MLRRLEVARYNVQYYAQGGGQGWALFTKKATIKRILLKILKNKALTLSNLQDSVNEY